MAVRNRRAVGKIDKLPPELKETVDQMLISGQTYREIVGYLAENGEVLSQAAVSRYAQRFLASAQQLRIAQENFRMILTETERYPDLDPAEAILRLSSQKVFEALSQLGETGFDDMAEMCMAFDEVESVYLMAGVYDFALIVKGETMQDIAMFVAKKLSTIDGVLSTGTHFILRRYKDRGMKLFSSENSADERSFIL